MNLFDFFNVYESINAFVQLATEIRYMIRITSHFYFASIYLWNIIK